MQDAPGLNFAGNIEGGDILHHAADVVICDGFIGNIVLKFGESLMPIVSDMVQAEMKRQQLTPDQQKAVGSILGSVRKGFESEERGGAPLMGVKGNVLIGHGRSNVRAVKQMILSAADMAEKDVVHPMQDAFAA
jgi:glycerol-3-phosphate acyltransferase PlsX